MKFIRVASDLHLEQWLGQRVEFLCEALLAPHHHDPESILVLAGDISSKPYQLIPFLNLCAARFPQVIYVPGNHEFYGHEISAWSDELLTAAESLPKHIKIATMGVETTEIEGVRFIFSTLWADGGASLQEHAEIGRCLRDFYVIKIQQKDQKDPRRFKVSDMKNWHKQLRLRIEAALKLPFDGPTVVVTHHMPSYRLCHPRFGGDINGGFASNMDLVLAGDTAPALWIHGHTHDTIDTKLWKTRVVCNPAGYQFEKNSSFNSYGPQFIALESLSG